ncbi:hypothetical protein GLOTRDRAFT_93941 [Gloeophyllum trabeum ATCC 11539]|uniref:Chromatin modification-related protein EAF7 n=1 Tax=Gloeophyllum trabeum (strain ATCC 11539 / FP-39264 / Madison 617) TaxID=670483 RepID=S7Q4M4_GLOTA|nr:uncharacterized protein GLOTRDRAFT_93941 [Gloeophyllum trabeum ATCC 11539]EPQ54433.1 hypothetical protein GLOTRDRAFT_93941 [Gloeophyllum trabeum ATCC 11539]
MAVEEDQKDVSERFLDTVEGEISFFRSIMRTRPVGIHRHFHVLSMRTNIHKDTGHLVTVEEIWDKLRQCYDLDTLEGLEYTLPHDPTFESLIAPRRMRGSASLPSSPPAPTPPPATRGKRGVGRGRGKRSGRGRKRKNTAGLVGGESDSSALTQESGDESVAPTPRESVATGTDMGSEAEAEEEEEEEREASAGEPQRW